jgi:hypothetical protein
MMLTLGDAAERESIYAACIQTPRFETLNHRHRCGNEFDYASLSITLNPKPRRRNEFDYASLSITLNPKPRRRNEFDYASLAITQRLGSHRFAHIKIQVGSQKYG